MYLTLLIIAIAVISSCFMYAASKGFLSDAFEEDLWFGLLLLVFIISLLAMTVSFIVIPSKRMQTNAFIQEHAIVQTTINVMREQGDITNLERVRLSEDIIDINRNLAVRQFYAAHPWFSIYHPSEILELEPIK